MNITSLAHYLHTWIVDHRREGAVLKSSSQAQRRSIWVLGASLGANDDGQSGTGEGTTGETQETTLQIHDFRYIRDMRDSIRWVKPSNNIAPFLVSYVRMS
jgi:hypothetical protein